jgi:epoxyqueuosine reductase
MNGRLTRDLKAEAARLGFIACSIADAVPLPETKRRFDERLERGQLSGLPWMNSDRAERATNPDTLLPGARSIVAVAAAYEQQHTLKRDGHLRGRVARYAWGRDYHRLLKKRLHGLRKFIEGEVQGTQSRVMVDYGPLAERAYAALSGLGWFGKSTNLLMPGVGSWVLLGAVLTTAKLEPDVPLLKTCGSCTRCVTACPTGAIVDGYVLDNDRCISFQTIENRGPIPRHLRPLIGDWLFGCDICQEVCPVGGRSNIAPMEGLSAANEESAFPQLLPLLQLNEQQFSERFAGRAIMRAKRNGLVRNACVVLGNLRDPRAVAALIDALYDVAPLVRGHAAWALGRIGGEAALQALLARRAIEIDGWVSEEIDLAIVDAREILSIMS